MYNISRAERREYTAPFQASKRVLMNVDGSHLPSLAIVGGRQARGVSISEAEGITEGQVSGIEDDGSIKVLCTTV